eukprot:TRINITY_DN14727_c0_g1_i1.p1 TRINITY_DN14727_c0_g1~~TRINITY_DN14727_c0_g1_i1.p1  ORF type:complete len:126 (-),score=12.28 TRINITY_DN14727_c0_g1_i1:81-458(-)
MATQENDPEVETDEQKAKVALLNVGESVITVNTFQKSTMTNERQLLYKRLSKAEAKERHFNRQSSRPLKSNRYGDQCPRCGKRLLQWYEHISSDGFAGVELYEFVCEDPKCGINRTYRFEGYGYA